MKKVKVGLMITSALCAAIALASCSKDDTKSTKIYYQNDELQVGEFGTANLTFKNTNIPYISLTDGVNIISKLRKNNLGDKAFYKLENVNNELVISNERNGKCIINKDNQIVTYPDYDLFTSLNQDGTDPCTVADISERTKVFKTTSSEYTKGKEVKIDLNKYSKLDIYSLNDEVYLPLSVFNSLLYNDMRIGNIAYNFNSLFIVPNSGLSTELFGVKMNTPLGDKFEEDFKKIEIDDEYSEYLYQSLCFDFDKNYGLKDKFNSFDTFLTEKNFKEELHKKDAKLVDASLSCALSYLNDGHTGLTDVSRFYELEDEPDRTRYNADKKAIEIDQESYLAKKKAAGITPGIQYDGNVAFITFDSFDAVDNDLMYKNIDSDSINTAYLFNKLYKEITKDFTINKVVVDLSSNEGGDADGLIYSLSVLFGEISFDMENTLSGAHNHHSYKADINLDGNVDNNDIGLIDYGINIYLICSKYTFSSANAMAVFGKINKPRTVILGEKTGGGPCAVRNVISPLTSTYLTSSVYAMVKKDGNNYVTTDGGVNADHALTEAQMVDRTYIKNNLDNWTIN